MVEVNHKSLISEVEYLHQSLFKKSPANSVVEKYIMAHQHIPSLNINNERMSLIIKHSLDVQACELALRNAKSTVTQKIWLLTFICETQPGYYEELHAKHNISKVQFVIQIMYWVSLTLVKKIKGLWLTRRYKLV